MRKKHRKQSVDHTTGGFDNLPSNSEFYTGAPTEQPLYQDRQVSESRRVRKTGRHQAVAGRRKEAIDHREKLALVAILKSSVMILLLIIAFFMLHKGIKLYEESIWMENQTAAAPSPVMHEVSMVEEFDIENQDSREQFAERIELWKQADTQVRSADTLLQRGNYDQAIERCQDALRLDPAHRGALERLGELYFSTGSFVEAVNAYIRLLSVDPSKIDVQKRLIQSLDAFGDRAAVRYMAQWYLDENYYDAEIQRYLANAIYADEEFEEAAVAYSRVLRDTPRDIQALERQAQAYMQIEQYANALVPLGTLRESNYRNQTYYKQIAVCNAQLKQGQETVHVLGRAAQLFGQKLVMGWMQDPQLDPVREDRSFQSFADRVGGEEFRVWLEKMAQAIEGGDQKAAIDPMLEMPKQPIQDSELLLKPRQ